MPQLLIWVFFYGDSTGRLSSWWYCLYSSPLLNNSAKLNAATVGQQHVDTPESQTLHGSTEGAWIIQSYTWFSFVNPAEMKGFSYLIPCFSEDLIVYFPTKLHHQSLPDDSESACGNSRLTLIVCRWEGKCRSLEQFSLLLCLASGPTTEDSIKWPYPTMSVSFEKWVWSDLKLWDLQSNLASWLIWLCLVSTAAQDSSPNGGIAGAGWSFLSILHHNLPKYRLMDWADGATFQ